MPYLRYCRGTLVYRYYVSGRFAVGPVAFNFDAGSFSSGSVATSVANVASSSKFTTGRLTADVVDPNAGGTTTVDALNTRGYIDVAYTLPSYATALDMSSVTDTSPDFTLAAQTPNDGTIALDSTRTPVLLPGNGNTVRYFTTGTLHNKPVVVTFIGGSVSFLDAGGKSIPLFAPEQAAVVASNNTLYVDVAFGDTTPLAAGR